MQDEDKTREQLLYELRELREELTVLKAQENLPSTVLQELQKSEIRFRSLVEQTTDAVFCYEYTPPIPIDLPIEEQIRWLYHGTLADCNDRCAMSYGAQNAMEVIGKKLTDLFGTTSSSLDDFFKLFIENNYRVIDQEAMEVLPDGSRRYFSNNGHGVVEDGKLVRVWGTFRDITERKHVEKQQLEFRIQQERIQLLEELVSDLSHDIKTPLSIISTTLYLLKKQQNITDQQKYLDRLETQIQRLNKLVEDILAMAQLDKGADLRVTPMRLTGLLENIDVEFRHIIENKSLTMTFDLNTDLPLIFGNEIELNRVFNNLLENAVRYTQNGGSITVRAYTQEGNVTVEIQDTGIGIHETDLPLIFNRFYRTDPARNANEGGTGLGLAIVKKVVELHAGEIEVESTPGEGTLFRIRLPSSSSELLTDMG